MMLDSVRWDIVLTFALMGVITYCIRGSFIVLGERIRLPDTVRQVLRFAPAAALASLVVPDLLMEQGEFAPLNAKLLAGVLVAVIVLRSRNPWWPFIGGMGLLLLLRKGFGW